MLRAGKVWDNAQKKIRENKTGVIKHYNKKYIRKNIKLFWTNILLWFTWIWFEKKTWKNYMKNYQKRVNEGKTWGEKWRETKTGRENISILSEGPFTKSVQESLFISEISRRLSSLSRPELSKLLHFYCFSFFLSQIFKVISDFL